MDEPMTTGPSSPDRVADEGGLTSADTWMRREIAEIPAVVARHLDEGAAEVSAAAGAIRVAAPRFAMIAARGTSDHAAVYGRYLLETHLGIPTGLAAPSVTTAYRRNLRWTGGLLVAVSQSGSSPDVVEVTSAARRAGGLTIAITNAPRSPLGRAAQVTIDCRAGVERSVAATKSYVAQLVVFLALVAVASPSEQLRRSLARLPGDLEAVLRRSDDWIADPAGPVGTIAATDRCLVVSRGYNLATALEIALKLKETAAIFAEPYSAADFLHGPVRLADPAVPLLALRPPGPIGRSLDAAVEVAARRGSPVWCVRLAGVASPRCLVLGVRQPDLVSPLLLVVPGQLLAESVARARGFDPDAPPGLVKATRTR